MAKLDIGIDLQNEYTEYAFYSEEASDVVCISKDNKDSCLRIPNGLFVSSADNKIYAGFEASELNLTIAGTYYYDILAKANEKSIVIINGKEYDYIDLFVVMMKLQLKACFGDDLEINKLIISSPLAGTYLAAAVLKLTDALNLSRDQVELVSSEIAMLFYVFKQDTGVYREGVGLYHYEENAIRYEHVSVDRYSRPMRVKISNKLYPFDNPNETESVVMARPPISVDQEDLQDSSFLNIVKDSMKGFDQRVSGVFLMGDSFEKGWLDESANYLCRGRRVFVGQSIYAKGAAYAAKSGSAQMGSNVFLESDTMIHYDIGVRVRYKNKEQIAPIVLGEKEWFNAYGSVDVFLDNTNRIEIDLYDNDKEELIQEFIEIKGLPKRPPKTTKLSISVNFTDEKRGEICIKDKGFGTMYPTTGKVYRKEFVLP
ncbi:MAG: hypothetical protein K5656_06160 [Lachnospiraceae bacterium]|nr:hypothetical protein [Lachnospiraceae bacterium]